MQIHRRECAATWFAAQSFEKMLYIRDFQTREQTKNFFQSGAGITNYDTR